MATYLEPGADRKSVLVLGKLDSAVELAVRARGMIVRHCRTRAAAARALGRDARALILPTHSRIRQDVVELHELAWDSGAIILVALHKDADAQTRAAMNDVVASVVSEAARFNLREGRIQVHSAADADAIGEACVRHRPGRQPAKRSGFRFQAGIDDSHKFLLRRSFEGYRRNRIALLAGGFTEACVYRVDATDSSGERTPFLAKIGPHEPIQTEIETTRDFVADRIPFPNHAPIIHDRCVVGTECRVIAGRLVDSATRFDEFLGTASEEDTLLCLDLTFRGALRVLHKTRPPEPRHLVTDYRESLKKRVIADAAALDASAKRAIAIDTTLAPPEALLGMAMRWPALHVRVCLGHGDLHTRNVFARNFGLNGMCRFLDVVLIDFESAGDWCAKSRDYASFDVSLALDELIGTEPLSTDQLEQVFSFESLFGSAIGGSRRGILIEHLRALAAQEAICREEYAMSLFAYLLRYARFTKKQPLDRCAAAYRAAVRLANALNEHFRG